MRVQTLKGLGLAAVALVVLAGCERIGNPFEVLTGKRAAPDEFQVITRQPLRMPPAVTLPEPRPGAVSPLEPDPNRDAVVALLGADAVPAPAVSGDGEQALLSAANAAASDPAIRQTLTAEGDEGYSRSGQPYEAPLLWEVFGLTDGPREDVLDPAAEARRLQTEGVAAAPIDPTDRPPEAEEPGDDEPILSYPSLDRRPQNTLPSDGAPAFE